MRRIKFAIAVFAVRRLAFGQYNISGDRLMYSALRDVIIPICIVSALAPSAAQAQHAPKSDAELIANAMSAAPAAISHEATIIAMDGDKVSSLRSCQMQT